MPFVDVDGQNLYYEDTGGELPVVVFSHGLLMDHEMFAPQVAALREDYRVITWDERCHGQTESTDDDFTYWDSADDLYGLLRHLGVERAVFAGMSQGGYLTLRLALDHPDLVAGLILLDTQAREDAPENIVTYEALLKAWDEQGFDAVGEAISYIILDARYPGTPYWIDKWSRVEDTERDLAFDAMVNRDSVVDSLPNITAPTLVVWGETDLAISRRPPTNWSPGYRTPNSS